MDKKWIRCALLLVAAGIANAATQTATGIVEGTITRSDTGEPIVGLSITVGTRAVESDARGHFIVAGLPPGTHELNLTSATLRGYHRPPQRSGPRRVTIGPNEHVRDLDLRLLPGGVISGRVLDNRGRPAPDLTIQVMSLRHLNGRDVLNAAFISGRTNDRGEYRLFGIEPGEYYLRARADLTRSRIATFYPGTTEAAMAQLLVVRPGEEISRRDFVYQQPPSGRTISGKLIFTSPVASSRMTSSYYLVPQSGISEPLDFLSDSGSTVPGEFEHRNVLPGTYDLVAVPHTVPDSPGRLVWNQAPADALMGRIRVEVSGADVTGIVLPMHPLSDVNGRVVIDDSPGDLKMQSLRIYLSGEEFGLGAVGIWSMMGQPVDDTGAFSVPRVPRSQYSVFVEGLPKEGHVVDVRQGSKSIMDTGLTVDNSSTAPLEITVSGKGAAVVEGTVRDASMQSVAYTTVVLVPQQSRRKITPLYKTALTDGSGRFSISGLAPDDYKLFAWERAPLGAWTQAEFLAPYEEMGTAIALQKGASGKDVVVPLIPKREMGR